MTDEVSRWARILQVLALIGAFLWSGGLLVFAMTAPVYQVSGSGTTSTSATLVDENGTGVLIVLAVPLAATLLVALALVIRQRWALWIACGTTAALALGNVAALLTVGIFVVPVTAALVVACLCAVPRRPPSDQAGTSAT